MPTSSNPCYQVIQSFREIVNNFLRSKFTMSINVCRIIKLQRNPGIRYFGRKFFGLCNLSLIHISEPTRRTPISYAVFCLKKKKQKKTQTYNTNFKDNKQNESTPKSN